MSTVRYNGVDISTYNTVSDYNKLAKNIDFAIIRTGFGNNTAQIDNKFITHIEGCIKAGVKLIGVYHFSYSRNVREAEREAEVCLEILNPYKNKINMFAAFDWEYDSYDYCLRNGITPTKALITDMCNAFCARIKQSGLTPAVYTNLDYAENKYDMSRVPYDTWIAQYNDTCQYTGKYTVWQYTSTGNVPGINGNVDKNYCYKDYIAEGVNMSFKKGDRNDGVLALKTALRHLYRLKKIPANPDTTSTFGDGTELDIKEVQKQNKLTQTGIADTATIKAIDKMLKKYGQPGDTNSDGKITMTDVTDLQENIAGIDKDI